MGGQNKPGDDGRSLTDDLAAQAGMPRGTGRGGSLDEAARRIDREQEEALTAAREASHAAAEQVRETGAQAADAAGSAYERARETATDTAADLKSRVGDAAQEARRRAEDAYDDARDWASERYDHHRAQAADLADRGYQRIREGRTATEAFVSENPLLVGVVGLAAGLLLGALLPRTRQEDQTLGPYADDLRDQGLRYARDMTHRGRVFVEQALDPDNLDAALHRSGATGGEAEVYEGRERKIHTL